MSSHAQRPHWLLLLPVLLSACGTDSELPPRADDAPEGGASDASPSTTPAEAGHSLTDFDAASEPFPGADASAAQSDSGPSESDATASPLDASSTSLVPAPDASRLGDSGKTTDPGHTTPFDAGPKLDASDPVASDRIVGRVRVRLNHLVDGDTPDPRRVLLSNDHFDAFNPARDAAQALPKPGWVTGYLGPLARVETAGAGAGDAGAGDAGGTTPATDGGSAAASVSDEVDYYKVRLNGGDTLTLYFETLALGTPDASNGEADLDLYLYEAGSSELGTSKRVADSQGSGNVEQVRAPHGGTFWVGVERYQPDDEAEGALVAARYALTFNVPTAPSVQNEVSKAKLSVADVSAEPSATVQLSAGPPTRRLLSALEELGVSPSDQRASRRARLPTNPVLSKAMRAQQAVHWIKRLRRTAGIESAELVHELHPQSVEEPDDPEFGRQWQHGPIDLQTGWAESQRDAQGEPTETGGLGEGVVVAVIDTGVAVDHPDFVSSDGSSQLLPGIDLIASDERSSDGDGVDFDPTEPSDPTKPGGGMFHGTHCAGNVAAALDNAVGIAGTAPHAKILPIRALGRAGGDETEIATAILYAAGLTNDSGELPEQKADIISMSLGGPGRSEILAAAISSAIDAGAIVVAAAGNFQSYAEDYSPGGEEGVLTVSAIDAAYNLAWYSNHGATSAGIDLAGVGGDEDNDRNFDGANDGVVSLSHADNGKTLYSALAGTSMASAQVAGVVALMKGVWPAMTASDLMALLPEITIDLGAAGPDPSFGHGLIDAAKAVSAARAHASGELPPLAVLRSSLLAVDFARSFARLPLEMTAFGAPSVQITGVSASEPWVRVSPGELGVNQVYIDRAYVDRAEGELFADLSWQSTAGDLNVRIHAAPDRSLDVGDVGELDVVLLDADTGEIVDHVVASSSDGYAFAFDAVPPGAYRVQAVGFVAASPSAAAALLETTLEPVFGQYRAEAPFGDGVVCRQVDRDDCYLQDDLTLPLMLSEMPTVLQTR